MLHSKPKSRAPGSRVIRKRRGAATASSGAQQSSGTAPSAQNDTDLDRIARMLSMGASSRARSPEPTSEFAPEGTGRRSPLANVSMNLDLEPATQPTAAPLHGAASWTSPGGLSHSSAHEVSANESAVSSSRRSGDASPLRTSTRGSAGMPVRSPSPTEGAMSRYAGSQPRSGDAWPAGTGSSAGSAIAGMSQQAAVATHFGPEGDLILSHSQFPHTYGEAAMMQPRAHGIAACSAVEARVMHHNAALGFYPHAEDTQDPFLDETVEDRARDTARPAGILYAQTAHLANAQLNSSVRDATASITLQLPSTQSRTLQPGHPAQASFRRGFASVGSLSLTGRHRSDSVQAMPIERHFSDPFLTDTVNLDDETRDMGGPPEMLKADIPHDSSHGGNLNLAGARSSALHRVSEMSEPHDTRSLSVGGTASIPVANEHHTRASSEGSGHSDPFLSESQV